MSKYTNHKPVTLSNSNRDEMGCFLCFSIVAPHLMKVPKESNSTTLFSFNSTHTCF